jgi:hypothetical protein
MPGVPSRIDLLSLIEPNTHLDRDPAFVESFSALECGS